MIMRTEKQMLELILGVAKNDIRVRAVAMSGSRNSPFAPKDIFMDFDIIYVVSDFKKIINDQSFFDQFGEVLILQNSIMQNDNEFQNKKSFINMMHFTDGNRIDLILINENNIEAIDVDSHFEILLDKDNILTNIKVPKKDSFLIKKPTQRQYDNTVNEFLWVSLYVAKGLWRRELPYAKKHFDCVMREQLEKMLSFLVGHDKNYNVTIGNSSKYLERYLPKDMWMDYQKTYVSGSYTNTWEGLLFSITFFNEIALEVAEANGFSYQLKQAENIYKYVQVIRRLPTNAKTIFPNT